ncbi:enoyl-CoA hydratase-related protein [Pseudofrankia inefficax]|uniref:Enoyl-CoA hydratase/isomerase n=1 Tax=Pseudofrankia inefficax (strain DSM 45817 / CECT 9037 / DDB 130130 / EuI1c) TaxID=298654 RepID=E3J2N1_PSEI1|nr:enoyl-CoA hydratase-related protein [Pseudofrankia inefficax]ADP80545.1 Enoyl-CoA hydratase/isomerase [Pseudofrankia inefficax]
MTADNQAPASSLGYAPADGDVAEVTDGPVALHIGTDGVGVVILNRPQRRNGWNPELEQRYFEVLELVDRDPRIRVVILTGAGTTFCPGVDSGRLEGITNDGLDLTGRRSPVRARALRKPMVAAVNGACAGMGLVQALLCDVRIAARGVRFTTAFARRGLAGEFGVTWLLPRLIGAGRAADLLLSSRVFDADEALALGLVNRVVEPGELAAATRAYAADIAENCSPTSLALLRHQLHTDQQGDLEASLDRSYRAMAVAVTGQDFREGLTSYLEKRKAAFPPLADDLDPVAVTGADLPELDLVPQISLKRVSTDGSGSSAP